MNTENDLDLYIYRDFYKQKIKCLNCRDTGYIRSLERPCKECTRQLDILIIENIYQYIKSEYMDRFHWKKYEGDYASLITEKRDYDTHPTQGDPKPQELPFFSTDIAAAWKVVEKMGIDDDIRIEQTSGGFRVWWDGKDALPVHAETAPLAICMASLGALGMEVE